MCPKCRGLVRAGIEADGCWNCGAFYLHEHVSERDRRLAGIVSNQLSLRFYEYMGKPGTRKKAGDDS